MNEIPKNFLTRIESLGDNCELGFVLRNLDYEKGGFFRWTITPIGKLIHFLENLEQDIFQFHDLAPFSPGMIIDQRTGFSFHTKMRSQKDESGDLHFVLSEAERQVIYDQEKAKLDYLLSGFLQRLNAQSGSIYLIKANNGIAESDIKRLAELITQFSEKHVLVEVRSSDSANVNLPIVKLVTHYVAQLPQFAPYVQANDIVYEDWNRLLSNLMTHNEINNQIGDLPLAA